MLQRIRAAFRVLIYGEPVRNTDAEDTIRFMGTGVCSLMVHPTHAEPWCFFIHPTDGTCFSRGGKTLAEALNKTRLGLLAYRLEHPEVVNEPKS